VGVGKESGGGHTVGAREGQQWGQGQRPRNGEGSRRGWPTDDQQIYVHYITIVD